MATAPEQKSVNITLSDLQTLIQEIRKPVPTPAEIKAEAQLKADRERMAETLKAAEANKQAKMKNCSHMRNNGSTTAVYITDLNRLYCQACTKWILPDKEPELFNKLFQLAI